tara:strand:+ start:6592 stop:7341 length:750 start_codon:yes stop_codon:yes gene_type:complete
MPTQDYTTVAASYLQKVTDQARSNPPAAIDSSEEVDRDNLLFFIEDNFKTNNPQGFTAENFRAFAHLMVKSFANMKDDVINSVINAVSGRLSTGAANRWYYQDSAYGWSDETWTTYTTSTINSTTAPSVGGLYGVTGGFLNPFDVYNFSVRGVFQNDSSTGDIDVIFYYSNIDDPSSTSLQNMTFIGEATIDCAVEDTGYEFHLQTEVPVPGGKHVFMFIKNTGWGSGTEYIKYNVSFYGKTRSARWTV